ncbi:hypothetical protein HERIO_665 [Hepatospora eriocheir]|uniref:Uncharacterized protein n=1 Tax=Hepatospora eriocheir TaxID=1081669 RepID=A0A1X0QCU4_9MICR|nr:hypothetical protein HERIO_665 [Hepatospora eriocheir]
MLANKISICLKTDVSILFDGIDNKDHFLLGKKYKNFLLDQIEIINDESKIKNKKYKISKNYVISITEYDEKFK